MPPCKFEVDCLSIQGVMSLGNYIVYTINIGYFVRPEPYLPMVWILINLSIKLHTIGTCDPARLK